MPDDTTILGLPLILANQAQKHVTHNEALALLDAVVQLAVINRDQVLPPTLAVAGDRHIVAPGGMVDWAGQDGKVAVMTATGWQFHAPGPGWRAHVLAEGETVVFDGLAWVAPSEGAAEFAWLGVSATPDATNRLAVSSPAVLLNHAGAGHQVKINKAADAETASLLFQTGFSGRAEMGTAGSDDFAVKVSADGTAWHTALTATAASGVIGLPKGAALADGSAASPALRFGADGDSGVYRAGANQIGFATGGVARAVLSAATLQVDVPVGGTAVTQSTADATAGRLLKVGDFGLGGAIGGVLETGLSDIDGTMTPQGFYQTSNTTAGSFPAGESSYGEMVVVRYNSVNFMQVWMSILTDTLYTRRYRASDTPAWSPWRPLFSRHNILGAVSQSGGVPTGKVIERGSNANGDYVRYADGTQMCWRGSLSAANASTADGALFRSANVGWTFPAAFSVAPLVSGGQAADADCLVSVQAPTVTSVNARLRSTVSKAGAVTFGLSAVGRWF